MPGRLLEMRISKIMTVSLGDTMPSGMLVTVGADGAETISSDVLFSGKKVVLFGLPGAFTPTCSARHLPDFITKAPALKAKGIDIIACISVNDVFVMAAWAKAQSAADKVLMVADGSAVYSKALGLELDLTKRGMGIRCTRFCMLIEDGIVITLNIEENISEAITTGADHMLAQL